MSETEKQSSPNGEDQSIACKRRNNSVHMDMSGVDQESGVGLESEVNGEVNGEGTGQIRNRNGILSIWG